MLQTTHQRSCGSLTARRLRTQFALLCATMTVPFASERADAQVQINSGLTLTQGFDTIGTSSTAPLPTGWRLGTSTAFSSGATATTQSGGTSGTGILALNSPAGFYNFAFGVTGSSPERAVGFLSSGSFPSTPAPLQFFVQFQNNSGNTLTSANVSFDIEKYRSGSRQFDINFFSGTDGTTWTSRTGGDQTYAADLNNGTVPNPRQARQSRES